MLVGEPALHRQHAAGVHVHRHETALHLGDLAQRPAHEGPIAVAGHGAHMHHVADGQEVARHPRPVARVAVLVDGTRPCDILGGMKWPSSSSATSSMPMRALLSPTSSTTAGVPAVDVARDLGRGQRGAPAPASPAFQFGRVDRVDRPAPAALVAVEAFQRPTQRAFGHPLQILVHRGAHGIAAGEEIILAVLVPRAGGGSRR
jgi:hypothetical protein